MCRRQIKRADEDNIITERCQPLLMPCFLTYFQPYIYIQGRANAHSATLYSRIYSLMHTIQTLALNSFYAFAISTIIESAPPSEVGPLIRNYSLVFPSHPSRSASSLHVTPERYACNDTIIPDKEKFLSYAINSAALGKIYSYMSQWK